MKNTTIPGILVVIALVLGAVIVLRPMAVYRFFHPPDRHEVVEKVFKDDEVFDVMMNSPQVTAQRLHRKSDTFPTYQALLSGYTRDGSMKLSNDQAQQIKTLLQSPSSYMWDVNNCLPDYGVVYNFQSGGHAVHVAFCFECNIIGVFDGDNDASNSINFTSLFNPVRGQMVTLSKTLFPNDREIQKLK